MPSFSVDLLKQMIDKFANLADTGTTSGKVMYLKSFLVDNPNIVEMILQQDDVIDEIAKKPSIIDAFMFVPHEKFVKSEKFVNAMVNSEEAMNRIAGEEALRNFVRNNVLFWSKISANSMASAKIIAGYAGLDPTAHSDLNTLLKDTSVFDNILSSSTACQVVHEIEPKWLPISDWDTAQVAFYPFEGNANDAFENYNGTWNGNELYAESPWGQAAKFDGSSYISLSSGIDISSKTYTISAWVKDLEQSQDGYAVGIINKNTGDYRNTIYFYQNKIYLGNDATDPGVDISIIQDSGWHSLIGIFNNGNTKLYVDDILKIDAPTSSNNYDPLILIANRPYGGTNHIIAGLIDNIRIFNRALTDEEVQRIYLYEKNAGGL